MTSVVVTDQDGNGVGIPEIISQEWDAVILDEAESVIEHAHGGTVKDRSRDVYGVLTNIVRAHTRQTILIDAHLSDYSINEYRSMMGTDYEPNRCVLIENTWKRGSNYYISECRTGAKPGEGVPLYTTKKVSAAPRLIRVPTPEDLENQLIVALQKDKAAYVAMTSVNDAQRLTRKLRKAFPPKHIVMVTGNHDDKAGEEFLKDPNGYMTSQKVDAAICSPAVESGVSIDAVHPAAFDVAFLFCGQGAAQTWQDLVQMVGRPRNLNYRWIFAYVAEHGPAKWLNESEYKQALIDARDDTYMMFREHIDPNGKLVRVPMDEEHLDSHVRTVVHINRSRVNLAKDFWDYWVEQGCEVIDLSDHPDELMDDDERKKLKNEKRADKLEIKEADAKATAEAKNDGMTVSEARKILDRDSKPEDKRKARKTLIEDFYDRPATTELVLTDNEGKFRQQIRLFNAVRMVATQGKVGEKKVFVAKDQHSFDAGVTATQRTETVRAMIAWELLQAAGVRPEHLDGNKAVFPGQVDLDNTTTYLQNSSVERRLKHLFGLNVQNYLKPGKRKNGTGVSLTKTKPTPVPLDKDETFHDPTLESMTDDEFDALATKAAEALKAQQKPAQPMKLIRDVARQIGLTFRFKQIRSGPNRGQREYRLKMETVDRMLDYGANDWKRLDSTTIPGQVFVDEGIEDILEFLAG